MTLQKEQESRDRDIRVARGVFAVAQGIFDAQVSEIDQAFQRDLLRHVQIMVDIVKGNPWAVTPIIMVIYALELMALFVALIPFPELTTQIQLLQRGQTLQVRIAERRLSDEAALAGVNINDDDRSG